MGRVTAVFCLILVLAGCGETAPPPAKPTAPAGTGSKAVANMVGEWQLESYCGEAPSSPVVITYRPDGSLEVQGEFAKLDLPKIKQAMDDLGRGMQTMKLDSVSVNSQSEGAEEPAQTFELRLRRK
ncbi:MAG: hypothetical protein ACKOGA_03285 [Planctomycetaceae bacterium]